MKVVEFKKVSKYYNDRHAVKDFSMEVEQGERIVILGPSGCGKTTVLRLLAGFIAPDTGSIVINAETVAASGKNFTEPEERNLGMVFQDLALWPHLTVKGNLEFGLKAKGIPAKEREQRINEILKLIQMEEYIHARPSNLSGGQQQRVALARSLVMYPEILLMDEPLSSIDFELNIQLRNEILRIQKQIGFTLVYVTHNLQEAFNIATYVTVMKDGHMHRTGPVNEIKEQFTKLLRNHSESEWILTP